jgi:hypothetical protein
LFGEAVDLAAIAFERQSNVVVQSHHFAIAHGMNANCSLILGILCLFNASEINQQGLQSIRCFLIAHHQNGGKFE